MHDESILVSSFRTFFKALATVAGLCVGVILIILIIAVLFGKSGGEIDHEYDLEILPNAKGIRKVMSRKTPVILALDIRGVIGTELLDVETIREQLIESREGPLKNDRVKAIILRINTPGGTVIDADGIYHALKRYQKQYNVPIYAHVDGLCASGGMYIASAADKIYASHISLIGSVGVLSPSFFNVSDTINKLGIKALTLTAGKGKDEMNPLRPWKPGEEKRMQDIIDYYYHHFVDIVSSSRKKLSKDKLIQEYGAHIFNADLAAEYGYIDESNYNFNDTLKAVLNDLGIEDDNYQVMEFESNKWLKQLIKGEFPLLTGRVTHQVQLSPDLDPKLMNQFLYLYRPSY